MKAVMMAGGEGTRLRPLTLNLPKPLVPVCDKPMMEHILEKARDMGIKDYISTLYYLGDEIMAHFGDGSAWGVNMEYSVEETPLGTAGAVKILEDKLNDTFIILSGDALTDMDLKEAVKFHKKVGSIATIVLTRVETPLEYGVVITGDDGRIIRFLEKPGWGEVFSDTVNTGIYIIDPAVFKYMVSGKNYDWSRDIFPMLLADGMPLYGCVLDGYWCDIGSLKQYREAHEDALNGRVKISFGGKQIKRKVWVGKNTEIASGAKIIGPAIIGSNCKIMSGAMINEFSVIGDNCIIEPGAGLTRSVFWNNVYFGRNSSATGAIVCRNNIIREDVKIGEGAILGDKCNVGKGAVIKQQVKIWPDKTIVSGATVTNSVIWGDNWPGALFSALGVKGVANVEITPEYAAALGTAYGASLRPGSRLIVSRSPHKVARIIKRALISGLMSVGVNVLDYRTVPLPVTRHIVRKSDGVGGIHIRISPYQNEMILIEFYDNNGINIDTNVERKIESIFQRQDYRHAPLDSVGTLEYDPLALEQYASDFLQYVDLDAIRAKRFRMVIDYSHGSLSLLLPPVLGRLGIEAISLNSYIDPNMSPRASAIDPDGLKQLSAIVRSLSADLGVLVDGESEKISLVDSKGRAVFGDRLLALMIELIALERKNPVIATQIRAPLAVEKIVAKHKGSLIYTKSNSRDLMAAAMKEKIDFGGDTKGGFIFPEFQPSFDAMISLSKILEIMAKHDVSLSDVNTKIPDIHVESATEPCDWDSKGKLMRLLVEKYKGKNVNLTDGLRISAGKKGWALMRPDPSEPLVHIVAEAESAAEAKKLVAQYSKVVREISE
ncbi:MAG TPA: sugar phosphate nucleotidyltransferase [bacterium]|nr:sugar phosphate nucleotidyltransferase [bacterium]